MRQIPILDGYFATEAGAIVSVRSGSPVQLKQRLLNGYWRVTVFAPGLPCRRIRLEVHRLVLTAFAGEPQGQQRQARHLNGVSTDNRACNLAWGTAADNTADAIRHGTLGPGMRARRRKLTADQVQEIRSRFAAGEEAKRLGAEYGVGRYYIRNLVTGRNWSCLPGAPAKSGPFGS